jgi:hypothetical protein
VLFGETVEFPEGVGEGVLGPVEVEGGGGGGVGGGEVGEEETMEGVVGEGWAGKAEGTRGVSRAGTI